MNDSALLRRIESRLMARMVKAINDFDLIHPGDRIMVAMSGGKDSYGLLHLLLQLRQRTKVKFELVAVNLDQGHPGFPGHLLEGWLRSTGVEYRMLREDTHSIVKEKVPEGDTTCWLCARLRRGILYNAAVELGCSSIALGHHRDDLIETLLLSALYSGQLKAMPAKLVSDDRRNTVIRPLAYCAEEDLAELARLVAFPIIPCDLCGSQPDLKRKRVKHLLTELEEETPGVKQNLLHALQRVLPAHLLDRDLHDFGEPEPASPDAAPTPGLVQLGMR